MITQHEYALEVLDRFGMMDNNLVKDPIVQGVKVKKTETRVEIDASYYKQVKRSLMYLITTRPT